jgi:uncharacterized membrane protein YcaP (DUF421 family)
MFELNLPLWQFPVRALLVYLAVLLMIRLSGKRTIGEFSPFDVVVLLLIAEAAQGSMTGNDTSLQGGLLVMAVLIALNYLVAWLSTRSRRMELLLQGGPVVLIRNGEIDFAVLRRQNVPIGDVEEAMRSHGIRRCADVELAVLEPNGGISFFERSAARKPAPD